MIWLLFYCQVSAKDGTGVESLLETIIGKIPRPLSSNEQPLKMLLFDSWYVQYRGVVCCVRVFDGKVSRGESVSSLKSFSNFCRRQSLFLTFWTSVRSV